MKTELIPRSGATNAYDLLLDVIKAIEEEPRRLDMEIVIADAIKVIANEEGCEDEDDLHPMGAPACGTFGCVAGWTMMLKGIHSTISTVDRAFEMLVGTENRGVKIGCDLNLLFFKEFPDTATFTIGTAEYAAEVIRRIRAFVAEHEVALRAREVPA